MYNDYSSMMPGGPGGVSISGKWMNKQTGETIIVRDNIITEQGMQLMTDKGMISMTEFSKYYVQASEEMYDMQGNQIAEQPTASTVTPISAPHTSNEPRPVMYDDELEYQKEMAECYSYNDPAPKSSGTSTVIIEEQKPQNTNYNLIDKLFNKLSTKPTIELTINWADFPKQELNTLIEYLDVDKKDIADYIYNTYADDEAIKFEVYKYLETVL